jgi:hypothetical protein
VQQATDNTGGLFHVSEEAGIKLFEPRPSPSFFAEINSDVVFAISVKLLHNYLLPRNCPRVTFYAGPNTVDADKDRFIGRSAARHIIVVENAWYPRIKSTILNCYEFAANNFTLLDECAGYYVSDEAVAPIAEWQVADVIGELLRRDVELRFTPSLIQIAEGVRQSTLNFSLIRMRNAKQ